MGSSKFPIFLPSTHPDSSKYVREVNNRLTGWAFAHPVNSTCPLPKIAHPVNYLAHRKMGTTFIRNRQFRPKFLQNWLTPKGKPHSSTPRIGVNRQYLIVLSWNLSISKFVGQYQHTLTLLFMKSYIDDDTERVISQIFREKHIICVRPLKNWRLPTQLIIFPDFWAKIFKICPPSKLFLFTSLKYVSYDTVLLWHLQVGGALRVQRNLDVYLDHGIWYTAFLPMMHCGKVNGATFMLLSRLACR